NSSPSATVRSTWSTAVTAPNRFTTPSMPTIIGRGGGRRGRLLLQLVPPGLDVRAVLRLERLRPPGRDGLVVHVGHLAVEVRAHAAGELHRGLRGRAGRLLHLVLRVHREQAALHEHLLPALGE